MDRAEVTRRSFLGALGTAGVVGLAGCAERRRLDPGEEIGPYFDRRTGRENGVRIPPGTYPWDGTGLDVRATVAGRGSRGDVVLDLQSGSMDGVVRGTLRNIVVRGRNQESKAGLDLHPGGEIDGFCWPEGGGKNQDRAIYHPRAGARTTIRNACVAGMANNGAYVDKAPVTVENSAFVNNNVANLRVGHAHGSDPGATSRVTNSLVAVTGDVRPTDEGSTNPVGLRIRRPGAFVVENCWFVFTDGAPAADGLVELKADEITADFRNCHFHNDTATRLVTDGGSHNRVTLTGCTVSGRGRTTVAGESVSGSLTRNDVRVPLPSAITGFPQADDAYGFDPLIAPFGAS